MVTLQDVKKAIDQFSPEERRELREYLEQREGIEPFVHLLSPEERIRRMDVAAKTIRAGMTRAELDDMTAAMNAEYIESFDEDVWKD